MTSLTLRRTVARFGADATLVVITLSVFFQVAEFGFLHFDDYAFVCKHSLVQGGLTLAGLRGLLTDTTQGNWVPLSLLSHMTDVQFFGMRPMGHHLVNLLFHLFNVLLLHHLMRTLTGDRYRSLAVAALFAIHPLQAEAVAWIAQRRTVLMTFFGLLALHAYRRYAGRPTVGRYLPVAALFLCGLLSKGLLVVLPLLMILLDYWPLGRLPARLRSRWPSRLLLEKVPLLALAAASGAVTFLAQREAQAFNIDDRLGSAIKASHALVSSGWYLLKVFWPTKLAVFYPYPLQGDPFSISLAAGTLLACVTLAILATAKRVPYLPVGWFWFLVSLLPVLGMVQAGEQAYADRYMYLPLIGMALLVVWGTADLLARRTAGRRSLTAAALAAVLALGVTCFAQVRHWSDERELFTHAVAVTGGSHVAHTQLGCLALLYGRKNEAIAQFQAAIRFSPDSILAHKNLGLAYALQGRTREAQAENDLARQLHP